MTQGIVLKKGNKSNQLPAFCVKGSIKISYPRRQILEIAIGIILRHGFYGTLSLILDYTASARINRKGIPSDKGKSNENNDYNYCGRKHLMNDLLLIQYLAY